MTPPPTVRPRRAAMAAVAAALLLLTGLVAIPPAGAQEGPTTMTFNGRGWGHGRGMSQWGSQGYATNFGWSYTRILDHYYGGTTMGTRANRAMLVRLMAQEGKTTTVQNDGGTLALTGNKGLSASGMKAVRMSKLADGTLKVEQASGCGGPWTTLNGGGNAHVVAKPVGGDGTLRLCREDGVHIWYPGSIEARVHENIQRTINATTMEDELRGIVPRESPASWHADALKAQSVAARSYALAGDGRHLPFADTCDTTLCQVYDGWFRQTPGGAKTPTTDPRTDAAIAATAGQVRVHASGAIARTEFSSSSGGYTAGGTFPAVPDEGDSIAPRHTWKLTVDMSRVESQHGKGGRLTEVDVIKRNGLGADGGRVLTARLRFSNGTTVDVSGNALRSLAGLHSDWFTPVCGREVRFVNAAYELFLGRTPSGSEAEVGCAQARRGERFTLTTGLSRSDEWAGRQISELYQKVFGRPADTGGRSYWLGQVQRGMRMEQIAAQFYGSEEYYNAAGRTPERFVDELYLDLMGRPSDPSGKAHWVEQLRSGRLTRTAVAGSFYASLESRRDRVEALYQQVLDRAADRGGREYWVDELLRVGDVALAAYLAASEEYYQRSLSA